MKTRALGDTGLEIGRVGLGAMALSVAGRPPETDGVRVVHAALDAGMTLIDTADVYCLDETDIGHNERLIARALATWPGPAEAVVVATKGGAERPGGDWAPNGRPEHLVRACERSLKALGVEVIDLYHLHVPDPEVPLAESVGALARLREAGKVRHVGLSNVTVDEIREAQAIVPITSVQNGCNLAVHQSFSGGVVRYCREQRITFMAHGPVGGHLDKRRFAGDRSLRAIGRRHGATEFEVAIGWLVAVDECVIPIPGASRVASAASSARAADLELTVDEVDELTRAFGVPLDRAGARSP